jgi:hypothetical protein
VTVTVQSGAGGVLQSRNSLINGTMLVWQRGTSLAVSTTSPTYTADRWAVTQLAGTVAITAAQEANPATGVVNSERVQRNNANTNTNVIHLTQVIESINVIPLQGQTVTLSFSVKDGANFSASGATLVSNVITGTGTDQGLASALAGTWTGTASNTQNNTLTTSRAQFTQTITVPSGAKEIAVDFSYTPVGTASTNDWFEIDSVQLEPGGVATPVEQRGVSVETGLCVWYYQLVWSAPGLIAFNTTSVTGPVTFLPMRTLPTIGQTGVLEIIKPGTNTYIQSSPSLSGTAVNSNTEADVNMLNFTGLTTGVSYLSFFSGNGNALTFSAEL